MLAFSLRSRFTNRFDNGVSVRELRIAIIRYDDIDTEYFDENLRSTAAVQGL